MDYPHDSASRKKAVKRGEAYKKWLPYWRVFWVVVVIWLIAGAALLYYFLTYRVNMGRLPLIFWVLTWIFLVLFLSSHAWKCPSCKKELPSRRWVMGVRTPWLECDKCPRCGHDLKGD